MSNILRKREVQKRVGLSDPSIWRLEKAGQFPKRIVLSKSAVGWLESEINDWIEARAQARG